MKYAVIKTGGKQYKVHEGEEILVDKLKITAGSKYIFPEVLFVRDEDKIHIGNPHVAKAGVTGKVMGDVKGKKITVTKFKAKVHYRKRMGFRPQYSKVLIEAIKLKSA